MMKEPEIKHWTAKRKVELIKQIYRGLEWLHLLKWLKEVTIVFHNVIEDGRNNRNRNRVSKLMISQTIIWVKLKM